MRYVAGTWRVRLYERHKLRDTMDGKVFKWSGHVQQISAVQLTTRVYIPEVKKKGLEVGFDTPLYHLPHFNKYIFALFFEYAPKKHGSLSKTLDTFNLTGFDRISA